MKNQPILLFAFFSSSSSSYVFIEKSDGAHQDSERNQLCVYDRKVRKIYVSNQCIDHEQKGANSKRIVYVRPT
jgi:hypothetical protein